MSNAWLDHFQMTVYEGEITGITGLADSGLTCIADVLSGRTGIEQGRIYLAGQKTEIQSLEVARNSGIHVISEKPVLFEHLTLEENICLAERDFFSSINFPSKKQIKRIRRCMEELECFLDLKKSAMALTAVEKHMVEMLRTYYNGGKVLLLNHIVGNCSEKECEQLFELIQRLKERGAGIVILDTSIERIQIISDTVLVMRGGRVEGICQGRKISKTEIEHILMGDYSIPDTCKKAFYMEKKDRSWS
ncbi:MAG: ATP-binding cassette domain-containing protein [Clostridiales bacterium]|nr:ATP-binding cassette domain-containing protein [Clostridiales bacterium]